MITSFKHFINHNYHHSKTKIVFGYIDRSSINVTRIGSFWKLLCKKTPPKKILGIEYIRPSDYSIFSFDGTESLFTPLNFICRFRYKGKLVKLSLSNGSCFLIPPKLKLKETNGYISYLNNIFDQDFEIPKYQLDELVYMLNDFFPGDTNTPVWGNIYNREVQEYLVSKLPPYIDNYEFLNKLISQYIINLKWKYSAGNLYYGENDTIISNEKYAKTKDIRPLKIESISEVYYTGLMYIIGVENAFIGGVLM